MRPPTHIGHSMLPSSSSLTRTNSCGSPSTGASCAAIQSLLTVPPR